MFPMKKNYLFPSSIALTRYKLTYAQAFLNQVFDELGSITPYEYLIKGEPLYKLYELSKGSSVLRDSSLKKDLRSITPRARADISYEAIYIMGGLMHIYYPPIEVFDDIQFKELLEKHESMEEALAQWKETPSILFLNLPPKLIWAGAGEEEVKLLEEVMGLVYWVCRGSDFPYPGAAFLEITKHVHDFLRLKRRGITIYQLLIREREKSYAHKKEILQRHGVETIF